MGNMGNSFSREGSSDTIETPPPHKPKVSMSDFETLAFVGQGQFGKVYKVRHLLTGKIYAMKVLKKSVLRKANMQKQALLERTILSTARHPCLVRLKSAFRSSDKLHLILTFAEGGELFKQLRKFGRLPEDWVGFYGAEILAALEYLHCQNIVYRDLKPENILLDSKGHVKLTDFGLASYCEEVESGQWGTPAYLAPEMVREDTHGLPADVWAFGVLLYELAVGHTPFYHKNRIQMWKKILREEPDFPEGLSNSLKDLIQKLLTKNQSERITMKEVKNHAFFAGVDWGMVEIGGLVPPIVPVNEEIEFQLVEEASPPSVYPAFDFRKTSTDSFANFSYESSL